MSVREVTLRLPSEVYEAIRQAAATANRPVDEIMVEAVIAAAPTAGAGMHAQLPPLAQLAYLNDAALWQAARATMPLEQREQLADLHDKQREGLTSAESAAEQALLDLYRGIVLVRAQAAALLKQRGYDVNDADQFAPLA